MLPKWLGKRHEVLWEAFQGMPFRFEEAARVLKEKNMDSEDQVNVFLAELRKKGWLLVESDPKDARKKIYKLKSKEEIISEILSVNEKQLGRGELEALLKKAADLIRTRVD